MEFRLPKVLGFDPIGRLPRFEEFFHRIHSEDQAPSREQVEKAIDYRGCLSSQRSCEPGDDVQGALLASRVAPIERGRLWFCKHRRRQGSSRSEMEPARRECLPAISIRQESEVANFDKASRREMEREATDELHRIELHDLAAVVMFGVAPVKTHLTIDQAQQSAVYDRLMHECYRGGLKSRRIV